jgi:hypothetical protein
MTRSGDARPRSFRSAGKSCPGVGDSLAPGTLAVGLTMPALVDDIERALSLAGALHVMYPRSFWATVNTRAADIQDLAFDESWFLAKGCL